MKIAIYLRVIIVVLFVGNVYGNQQFPPMSTKLDLGVAMDTPQRFDAWPRRMKFYLHDPISWSSNPVEVSKFTIDFGDGNSGKFKDPLLECVPDNQSVCNASFYIVHSFLKPGEYTAVIYKNNISVLTQKFKI